MASDMPSSDVTSTGEPVSKDAESELVGDALEDRYRIDAYLASGAHGDVLAAFDRRKEREVAIKLLSPETQDEHPRAVARMRQEAEILKVLEHPNLVQVYDIDAGDRGAFLVMELLAGRTLADVIDEERDVEPERVGRVAHQLLDALGAMHERGIRHRDIKPDNVLLDDSDDTERAKLVDLGIAQADNETFDPDHDVTLVETQGSAFLGTPRYASPEQAVGDPIRPSSDLFSLGLVLVEWLQGEPLIESSEGRGALSVLVQPEPFDLSACPDPWQSWLERMVAKPPSERFQSADQALEHLPDSDHSSQVTSMAPESDDDSTDETTDGADRTHEIPESELVDKIDLSGDADGAVGLEAPTVPAIEPDHGDDAETTVVSRKSALAEASSETTPDSESDLSSTLETDLSLDDDRVSSPPPTSDAPDDEMSDGGTTASETRPEPLEAEETREGARHSDAFVSPRTPSSSVSPAQSASEVSNLDDSSSAERLADAPDASEASATSAASQESRDDACSAPSSSSSPASPSPFSGSRDSSPSPESPDSSTSIDPGVPDLKGAMSSLDDISEASSRPSTSLELESSGAKVESEATRHDETDSSETSASARTSEHHDADDTSGPSLTWPSPEAIPVLSADVVENRSEYGKTAASVLFLIGSVAMFLWMLGWL